MGISTKSTYGIRAMFELALHYSRKPISVAYISERENISVPYLEQLLSKLRRKGLVKSVRGPKGGYILAKKPKDITVGDIVRTLDGDITPVHCVSGRQSNNSCKMIDKCVTKAVWKKLKDAIDNLLDGVTLKDLCGDAKRMGIDKAIEHKYTFHI
jgi:Rrf2 family protein